MSKRDASHIKAQKQGKKRDFYTCQICGSTENTEGHHIIDFQFSGSSKTDNIITLCRECHKSVHKGNLSILKF